MKALKFTLLALSITHLSFGQTAKTEVIQDENIEKLLVLYETSLQNTDYYRIQVGFGSHAKALQIKNNVDVDFPELNSKIDFDSPTYRVRVGRFSSKMDAERKFNEVRKKYPNAMLLKPKKSTK